MELADLIDLEWQLQADQQGNDPAVPRTRDRTWGASVHEAVMSDRDRDDIDLRHALVEDRAVRADVCRQWLQRLRKRPQADELPGRGWAAGLRWTTGLLVILGALIGWGTASAALAYDKRPVNVLVFIGIFVVLQLGLLLGMVIVLLCRGRGGGLGAFPRLVGALAQSSWIDRLAGGRLRRATAAAGDMHSVRGLYGDIGVWALFRATQWFGVAFNAAALVTCLLTVTFTDLVFSWSTTLDVDPGTVHSIVRFLAAPWSWVPGLAETVPTRELVENSQWVRMENAFVGGGGPDETAPWWRFLVAGLVVYGLIPRLAALGFATWRMRRSLRRASLDHGGYQRLYERLLAGVDASGRAWSGPAPGDVRGDAPSPAATGGSGRERVAEGKGATRALLCWGRLGGSGDRVAALWSSRGVTPIAVLAVGGADLDADGVALARLRADGPPWVTVVMDFDQQPTKEVLGFLRDVREAVGTEACVTVQLVTEPPDGAPLETEGDPEQWSAWDRSLRSLADPYLWLEAAET